MRAGALGGDDPNPRAQAIRLNNAQLMLAAMERRGDLAALEHQQMEPCAPHPPRGAPFGAWTRRRRV